MATAHLFCTLLILTASISGAFCKESAQYTPTELRALKEFLPLVKNLLKKDYEQKDIYLIHWLRARNFDFKAAKSMLEQAMIWRKEQKVDNVLSEQEMQNFVKIYPSYFGEAKDKRGRPAYQCTFGKWDIRKGVLAGHNLPRYLTYSFENITSTAFNSGHSDYNFLVDMNGFNLRQQGCVACVGFFVDLINQYEKYYPNMARIIYLLNTPRAFQSILQIIIPLMSPLTQNALKVFGLDKAEWQSALLREFHANQLTSTYGGTKAF